MKINCQAFLENKKVLSINKIDAQIDNYNYDQEKNEVIGNIKVITNCYIDNMDEIKELNDTVPFNIILIDYKNNNLDLNIVDLVYNLIEGRGIELEFDIVLNENEIVEVPVVVEDNERKLEEESIIDEDETMKNQIVEEIDLKLTEKLEQVDDNFPVEDNSLIGTLDRSYTHLKITFNKNNNIKIEKS